MHPKPPGRQDSITVNIKSTAGIGSAKAWVGNFSESGWIRDSGRWRIVISPRAVCSEEGARGMLSDVEKELSSRLAVRKKGSYTGVNKRSGSNPDEEAASGISRRGIR